MLDLLIIIIIIIIIFRVGREYRIYSIKREREGEVTKVTNLALDLTKSV